VVLHNVTDLFSGQLEDAFGSSGPNWFLKILCSGGPVHISGDGPQLFILYVIVPWIGVMMAGYAFGTVMERSLERRRAICLRLGVVSTPFFIGNTLQETPSCLRQSRAVLLEESPSTGEDPHIDSPHEALFCGSTTTPKMPRSFISRYFREQRSWGSYVRAAWGLGPPEKSPRSPSNLWASDDENGGVRHRHTGDCGEGVAAAESPRQVADCSPRSQCPVGHL